MTGGCTGTLITADVVLTAVHCLGSGPPTLCEEELGPENPHGVAPCTPCGQDTPGSYGSFEIFTAPGALALSRTVDRYVALASSRLGEGDLALLHLNEPVPADVAVPAGIAFPHAGGEWVTLYGYGCGSPGGASAPSGRSRISTSCTGPTTFAAGIPAVPRSSAPTEPSSP